MKLTFEEYFKNKDYNVSDVKSRLWEVEDQIEKLERRGN